MVTNLLQATEMPAELTQLIQEKAEGNPLFV
jgi:predicted ATPase